ETRLAQKLEPELDRIALNAIQRTRFTPAMRAGQPEAVWISIPIIFALKDWQFKSTPFKNFEMSVRPNASYQIYAVEIQGNLKPGIKQALRYEYLLPVNADQAWVKTGSGKPIKSGVVRDENGEWLIFKTKARSLTMGFNYRPLSGQDDHKFKYKFVMNQPLPAWRLVVIYGDQQVRFSQDPDRISEQSDGSVHFEYDLEQLEAFEARYLEIELIR
ncbi:MAG: energy transducer TonB, partial [Candidatus Marinimicrobia bacterium]|nr:energy transducer TonB [Candidatus Neomarinimicrobiota bacterium]